MELNINTTQLRNLKNGKNIRLSQKQLMQQDAKSKHMIQINPTAAQMKKIRSGKGVMVSPDLVNGGSFSSVLSSVASGAKKVASTAQKMIPESLIRSGAKTFLSGLGLTDPNLSTVAETIVRLVKDTNISGNGVGINSFSGNGVQMHSFQGNGLNSVQNNYLAGEMHEAKDKHFRQNQPLRENVPIMTTRQTPKARDPIRGGSFNPQGGSFQMQGGSFRPQGQGFLKSAGKAVKSVGKAVKSVAKNKRVQDLAFDTAYKASDAYFNGSGLMKSLKKGATKIANNKQVQDYVINQGVKYANNYLTEGQGFIKSLKKGAKSVGKTALKVATDPRVLSAADAIGRTAGDIYSLEVGGVDVNPYELGYTLGHDVIAPQLMKGSGFKKVAKGSQEAKDKMARIRAMRK
jgi:hypothetical protein